MFKKSVSFLVLISLIFESSVPVMARKRAGRNSANRPVRVRVDAPSANNTVTEEKEEKDTKNANTVVTQESVAVVPTPLDNTKNAEIEALKTELVKTKVEAKEKEVGLLKKNANSELVNTFLEAKSKAVNACDNIGREFNSLSTMLGFSAVVSTVSTAAAGLKTFQTLKNDKLNRDFKKSYEKDPLSEETLNNLDKITERDNDSKRKKIETVTNIANTATSMVSTVTTAAATAKAKSLIDKVSSCLSAVKEFNKTVSKIEKTLDEMEEAETGDVNDYSKLDDVAKYGSKIVSECNKMSEKDMKDIHGVMVASTTASAVGATVAVASTVVGVVSTVKNSKGTGNAQLNKASNVLNTASAIGSTATSLGSTILNAVAKGKLTKLTQAAVNCEALLQAE